MYTGSLPMNWADPLRNDSRVTAHGVLARPKDVEVPQADRGQPVAAGKDVCVELVRTAYGESRVPITSSTLGSPGGSPQVERDAA
jgi:hypothetical protein